MARLRPFRALRYAARVEGLAHLLDAPNPAALIKRWWREGVLVQDAREAFYVLEVQPAAGGMARRRAPVRYLLGALEPGGAGPSLEREASLAGPQAPVPVLAADDQRALQSLLNAVIEGAPPEWEG